PARGSCASLTLSRRHSSEPVAAIWYSAFGTECAATFSAEKVWNFTASAPLATAASINFIANPRSPLWLTPASAMTKQPWLEFHGAAPREALSKADDLMPWALLARRRAREADRSQKSPPALPFENRRGRQCL